MIIPEEVPLKTYFAVQVKQGEIPHDVAAAVCNVAKEVPVLFRRLELLDTFTIGSLPFVRFRSDVLNPFPFLEKLVQAGRAIVQTGTRGYVLRRTDGREGSVSVTLLHGEVKPGGQRMYRGPKIVGWQRQFEAG